MNLLTERIMSNGLLSKYETSEMEYKELLARMQGGNDTLGDAWRGCVHGRMAAERALWLDTGVWLKEPMPDAEPDDGEESPGPDTDIAAGRTTTHETMEGLIEDLDDTTNAAPAEPDDGNIPDWRTCLVRMDIRLCGMRDRVGESDDRMTNIERRLRGTTDGVVSLDARMDKLSARVAQAEGREARTDATLEGAITRMERLEGDLTKRVERLESRAEDDR